MAGGPPNGPVTMPRALPRLMVMLVGQEICRQFVAQSPVTLTLNDFVTVLLAASFAVQITVVAPIGNVLPDGGTHIRVGLESVASMADAVKLTTAPSGLVQSAATPVGT